MTFLEVNPRIQVEHTVTEESTGVDLVTVALRVAGGMPLAAAGVPARPAGRGFAVQARLTAEAVRSDGSVAAGTGRLTSFLPPGGRGVRVDTHGYPGYEVSPRYDSLLAKVIASGASLDEALRRLRRALDEFDIQGVATNADVLRAVIDDPALAEGRVDTGYVDARLPELAGHAEGAFAGAADARAAPLLPGEPLALRAHAGRCREGPRDPGSPGRRGHRGRHPRGDENAPRGRGRPGLRHPRDPRGGRRPRGGRPARRLRRAIRRRRRRGTRQPARRPGSHPRRPAGEHRTPPLRPRRGAPAGRGPAARRGPPHRPREPYRPGRRGLVHRVRRAGGRRPAFQPPAAGTHRADPGGRLHLRHRDGRRGPGRGDVLRLHGPGGHPGHARPPQGRPVPPGRRAHPSSGRHLRGRRRRARRRQGRQHSRRAGHRDVLAHVPAGGRGPAGRRRRRVLLRRERGPDRGLRRHHRHPGIEPGHGRPGHDRRRRAGPLRAPGGRAHGRPDR